MTALLSTATLAWVHYYELDVEIWREVRHLVHVRRCCCSEGCAATLAAVAQLTSQLSYMIHKTTPGSAGQDPWRAVVVQRFM